MIKKIYCAVTALFFSTALFAQTDDLSNMFKDDGKKSHDPVAATFKTTRLNMGHSIEVVGKHQLDVRISHVFGVVHNTTGTADLHTLYGLESISNVRIAFEYGVTNRLTAGFGRSKGFGAAQELYDGFLKYKLLRQTMDNKMPVTVTLVGTAQVSGMKASTDPTSETYYQNFAQRWSYSSQALIARKFSERLSLQLMPTWIHRNFVANENQVTGMPSDENDYFAMGVGGRFKFSKRSAIIIDWFMPFSNYRKTLHNNKQYYNPLGIGYEIETGGHVFHLSLVNTGGFTEQDFISNSPTSWTNWGFRLGFNISRWFTVGH
jgi:hypothetical protein